MNSFHQHQISDKYRFSRQIENDAIVKTKFGKVRINGNKGSILHTRARAHTHTHTHTHAHTARTRTHTLSSGNLPSPSRPSELLFPDPPSRPPHVSDSPEVQTLERVEVRDGAGEGRGADIADAVATGAAEARVGMEGCETGGGCVYGEDGGRGAKTPILLTESQPASAVQERPRYAPTACLSTDCVPMA